jgi:metallo-beta-lactamase family protein
VRVQFWGGARSVTGSMHLVNVNGHQVLIDCGLLQGRRKEAFETNRNFPFDARDIESVILTHAHIDHSGNLPSLIRAGFSGEIYATSATRDLAGLMLLDSAHIQEQDVHYVNKRRLKQGKRPFEPLYTQADAMATLEHFRTAEYDRPFEAVTGLEARFIDAGHILGSATVILDAKENGRAFRTVFSGDIGRKGLPILRDPQIAEGVDFLVMESTYGDRFHETPDQARESLRQAARQTYERGGKLLIPCFAVGRTQEIVYELHQLWEEGTLPQMDVFVDSPLAVNVTEVFRMHPECFDSEVLDLMLREHDRDPFGFSRLRYVRSVEASKELNTLTRPVIIISASGMCEFGRILHHLKNNIEDARTIVLIVGFQAENTLGRKLVDGQSPVPIFGEYFRVNAEVRRADGYSAHADQTELVSWANRIGDKSHLQRIYLVHGEELSALALAKVLREQPGAPPIEVPQRGDAVELIR